MRLPIQPYGFVTGTTLIDLRNEPEDVQDTFFLLTCATTFDVEIYTVDGEDEVASLGVSQVRGLPVRGPILVRANVPGNISGDALGYLEDGAPSTDVALQPVGSQASDYYAPIVLDATGALTLCEVGEEAVSLHVYVSKLDGDAASITYTPQGEAASSALLAPSGATNGFIKIVDGIPVVGPGVFTLSATVNAGPVIVYAWLSRSGSGSSPEPTGYTSGVPGGGT